MKQLFDQLREWWCVRMHDAVMWPSHGKYRCRTCLREYAVEFENMPTKEPELGSSGRTTEPRPAPLTA